MEREPNEQVKISALVSFEELDQILNEQEKDLLQKLRSIDPKQFGIKSEYIDLKTIPTNIVAIEGQRTFREGKEYVHSTQYLPAHIFNAYNQMKFAFELDQPGRKLLIESGYRSPAFQIITLIFWLKQHNYDLQRTMQQVAMPEYSQHCSSSQTALDIMTIEGIPTDEAPMEFKDTAEYHWLKTNAHTFGFIESYPENNQLGIQWEPWHWQYKSAADF